MILVKINYTRLNSKQKEIYNFQKAAFFLAEYGFNCIKLADDWQGADFLAYHYEGKTTLKVQLKGRLTISKKYERRDIFIMFPYNNYFYLIPHDDLVEIIRKEGKWLETESWKKAGSYHSKTISKKLSKEIEQYKLTTPKDIIPDSNNCA